MSDAPNTNSRNALYQFPPRAGTKMDAIMPGLIYRTSSILDGGPYHSIYVMDPILQLQGVRAHKTEGVTLRSTQLMMPAVTLFCRCRGLPRASTHSPARRPLEVPSLTEGKGCLLMICTTARSETLLQQSHVIATVALGCGSCKCYTLPCLREQISLVVPNGADFPFNPWSRSLKVAMWHS